ncbi:hypothetical protein BKA70DRAFT_1568260 [Coprinopsis sp. MPI-PUGE-AT-0042]|nr:hypothetical protein BKA70DRAFT_1568260 [Coprinopsis sp. MPI-PUGE-AT-0042]
MGGQRNPLSYRPVSRTSPSPLSPSRGRQRDFDDELQNKFTPPPSPPPPFPPPPPTEAKGSTADKIRHEPNTNRIQRIIQWVQKKGIDVVGDSDRVGGGLHSKSRWQGPVYHPPPDVPSPNPQVPSRVARSPDRSRPSWDYTRRKPEKSRATKTSSSRDDSLQEQRRLQARASRSAGVDRTSKSSRKESRVSSVPIQAPPSSKSMAPTAQHDSFSQSNTALPHPSPPTPFKLPYVYLDYAGYPSQVPNSYSNSYTYPHTFPLLMAPSSVDNQQQKSDPEQPPPAQSYPSVRVPPARPPQYGESPPPIFMPSPPESSPQTQSPSGPIQSPASIGHVHSTAMRARQSSILSPPISMMITSPPGMASPQGQAWYRGYEESLLGSVRSGGSHLTVK